MITSQPLVNQIAVENERVKTKVSRTSARLTRLQMLRYPFSVEARESSQRLARDIESLVTLLGAERNEYVVEEAENRVIAALDQSEIGLVNNNDDRDFLTYPTARLIVEKIGDPRLKEYQAEAESKAVNSYLENEKDDLVLHLCESALGWQVQSTGKAVQRANLPLWLRSFDFRMRFEDFLEIAPEFHQSPWKLVNRYIDAGWVPVQGLELKRLMSGKFKQLVLTSRLEVRTLPARLTEAVQRVESELRGKIKTTQPVKITENIVTAFPPCIRQMHEDSMRGKNLPHEARFALAAFLLKIGMSQEEVLGVFKSSPDFVSSLAEYQVRHISSKSGGEGYTPPGCRKLQGNGLCPVYQGLEYDSLCEYVKHPLGFYKTRAWEIMKEIENHSWYAAKRKKQQSF
jgi:DNA primase large subunit